MLECIKRPILTNLHKFVTCIKMSLYGSFSTLILFSAPSQHHSHMYMYMYTMDVRVPVLLSCVCRGVGWPGGEVPQLSAPGGGRGHETWRWSVPGDRTSPTKTDQCDPWEKLTHIHTYTTCNIKCIKFRQLSILPQPMKHALLWVHVTKSIYL